MRGDYNLSDSATTSKVKIKLRPNQDGFEQSSLIHAKISMTAPSSTVTRQSLPDCKIKIGTSALLSRQPGHTPSHSANVMAVLRKEDLRLEQTCQSQGYQ